nr:hypothetical protein [Candidatus Freyarchaeota archaeon]
MHETPALIYRMLQTFRSRTSESKQYPDYSRAMLADLNGKYGRERTTIMRMPGLDVQYALREFIFDSVSLFYDATSTAIAYLDDKEQLPAQIYMGVDCQFSLASINDAVCGYLSQSLTIRNDPTSMNIRRMLLEQTDNTETETNPNGVKILNNEWLVRMGWAYIKDNQKTGEAKWADDNIEKLIQPDGKITGVILHEMGYDDTGKPKCIIYITDQNQGFITENFEHGVIYKKTSSNGRLSCIEIVHKNLDYLNPVVQSQLPGNIPERIIGGKYKNMFLPMITLKKGQYVHDVPGEASYEDVLDNLMSIFGAPDTVKNCYKTIVAQAGDMKRVTCIEIMLAFLSPNSPNNILSIVSPAWDTFKYAYEKIAQKNLEVKTSPDREWTDRITLLSLLGDSITESGLGKIFTSINIDPTLLSAVTHPLNGFARANTPFFRIAEGQLPQIQPYDVDPEEFDVKKPTIAFIDYIESTLTGKTIVVVPVFKENSKYDQSVDPDEFNSRIYSSSPVSIVSKENELWSNVASYLLYEYKDGKYTQIPKPFAMNNEYFKNEYTPTSIAELGKFLRLLSHTFEGTTSYVNPDSQGPKYTGKQFLVSPKNLCDQLEAMLYSYPILAITICQELGILDALNQIREIYPIAPSSNIAVEGWFIEKDYPGFNKLVEKYPDAKTHKDIQKGMRYLPTSTDRYIALLSILGFQRLGYKKDVMLPMIHTSEGALKYKVGSAQFDPNNLDDLKSLDSIGSPVDEKGNLFKKYGTVYKTFQELKEEGRLDEIKGINLHSYITPYKLREVFHGRISNVPPPEMKSEIFEKVTKWNLEETGKPGPQTGYYQFCEWILDKLKLDPGNRQGYEKMGFISLAVRTFVTNPVYKIMELREKLADKYFIPVLGIVDTYFLVEAYAEDSEKSALNWFGNYYNKLIKSIKQGDVFKVVSQGFEQALKYISDKLANTKDFEVQGEMLRAMIKLGKMARSLDQIRPETMVNPFAKTMYVTEMLKQIKPRLETIKEVVDSSLMAKLQLKTLSGTKYINDEYAMQLVAWCRYQAGMEDNEIAKKTGLSLDDIKQAHTDFYKYLKENHITEQGDVEMETLTLFEKICQGPTLKTFKSMLSPMNLISTGGQMSLGGITGAAHVAPFMTIVAPVLQAVGYTLVAALEACTLSPIFDFTSGNYDFSNLSNYYWGGCITWNMMNPDTNIMMSILMAAAVYLTDYMEFGEGAFKSVRCGIDMDWVNVILQGMQSGMMTLGMGYVSEDTLADLMKPFLGVFGALAGFQYGGPLGAIIGGLGTEAVGLVSMLPQADQFYKEKIWPAAKLLIGASLMGGVTSVIGSAIANTVAMTGISAVENAWVNNIIGLPWMWDVTLDFSPILEYLPSFGLGGYDYIANYITHYVYGMW